MNRKNCKHEETDSAARVGGNTVCDAKSLCVGASGPRDGGPYRRRAPYEKGQGQSGQVARRRVDRLLRLVARRLQTADARRPGLRSREGRPDAPAAPYLLGRRRGRGRARQPLARHRQVSGQLPLLHRGVGRYAEKPHPRAGRLDAAGPHPADRPLRGRHALSGAYPLSGQYDDRLLQGRLFRQGDALPHHLGFGDRPASPSVEFHRSGVAARPVYGLSLIHISSIWRLRGGGRCRWDGRIWG